jgi:hypothetical protein
MLSIVTDHHPIDVGVVFEERCYSAGHKTVNFGFGQSSPKIRQRWRTHDCIPDPVGSDHQHGLEVS